MQRRRFQVNIWTPSYCYRQRLSLSRSYLFRVCHGSRWVFAPERLTSNIMSRRGRPRYFDYCRIELKHRPRIVRQFQKTILEWLRGLRKRSSRKCRTVSILIQLRWQSPFAKVIIEIKDVGCYLCILGTGWLLYQAVGDNNDELAQRLEDTAKRLLALERTVVSGVLKAAEEAMKNLKSYFFIPKGYHKEHVTIQNSWGRNEEIEKPCQ